MKHYSIIAVDETKEGWGPLMRSVQDIININFRLARRCLSDKAYPLKLLDGLSEEQMKACCAIFDKHNAVIQVQESDANNIMIAFDLQIKPKIYPIEVAREIKVALKRGAKA